MVLKVKLRLVLVSALIVSSITQGSAFANAGNQTYIPPAANSCNWWDGIYQRQRAEFRNFYISMVTVLSSLYVLDENGPRAPTPEEILRYIRGSEEYRRLTGEISQTLRMARHSRCELAPKGLREEDLL